MANEADGAGAGVSAQPAQTAQVDSSTPVPASGLRLVPAFCLLAALCVMTAFASWRAQRYFAAAPSSDDLVEARQEPSRPANKPVDPAHARARGDEAFAQHRFAEALSFYGDASESGRAVPPGADYRRGLCHESLGQFGEALAAYRQAMSRSAARAQTLACQLGIARCLLAENKPLEARQVLYPALFDEAWHEDMPSILLADAQCLVGLSLICDRADDEWVSHRATPTPIPFYLDEQAAVPTRSRAVGPAPMIPVPLEIKPKSPRGGAIVLRAERRDQPAGELLDQLAREGELKSAWSARAKKIVADRVLDLHVHNWELADLLDQASDYLDLVCETDAETIRFSARDELDAKAVGAFQRRLGQRVLTVAVNSEPGQTYMPAALIELGNAEATQGRWRESAFWYNRLVRETPSSRAALAAYFNLGQLSLRTLDSAQARKSFFRAVDHSPGHELAARAYHEIGKSYLYDEETKDAIVNLRRAQTMAVRSVAYPRITLMLAAAHLQAGDLAAARQVLAKSRASLQKAPCKSSAMFLDNLAQYRLAKATKDPKSARRELGELVGILQDEKDQGALGTYGQWLLADAYRELGFADHAVRVLRSAVAQETGTFKACLEYSLAENLARTGKPAEAAEIFTRLAKDRSHHSVRARFQLARIDLDEKRFGECAARCRDLWTEHAYTDATALLTMWGSALEANGDLEKASKCFAGIAPE